jgi:hypothetical protein
MSAARCGAAMTLEEVGKRLGLSRESVRNIEIKALNKLRSAMGSQVRGAWTHYETEGIPDPTELRKKYDQKRSYKHGHGGRFTR